MNVHQNDLATASRRLIQAQKLKAQFEQLHTALQEQSKDLAKYLGLSIVLNDDHTRISLSGTYCKFALQFNVEIGPGEKTGGLITRGVVYVVRPKIFEQHKEQVLDKFEITEEGRLNLVEGGSGDQLFVNYPGNLISSAVLLAMQEPEMPA